MQHGSENLPPPGLVVDEVAHRGFLADQATKTVSVYDLRTASLLRRVEMPFINSVRPYAAVDPLGHRIFWTTSPLGPPTRDATCRYSSVMKLDTISLQWTQHHIPCLRSVPEGLVVNGISYDADHDKLMVVGYPQSTLPLYPPGSLLPRQPTIVAQLDPDSFQIEWEADVSPACEWHQSGYANSPATVARVGDIVMLYCLQGGINQNAGGARGAVVTIPLRNGQPIPTEQYGHHAVVSPTFRDSSVRTLVDERTGRILIAANNIPFGPAVWVVNSQAGLFEGVLPSGVNPNTRAGLDYGFDQAKGRLYLHSSQGFVVADIRHSPLPGGVTHAVADEPVPSTHGVQPIAIDSGLQRLFMWDEVRRGWRVFDDDIPPYVDPVTPDPDRGTADIPEVPGATSSTFSATGSASGLRVLNVGGLPSALQGAAYRADCVRWRIDKDNSNCVFPLVVSPGDREYYVAQTSTAVSKSSGGASFAIAGRASPRDFATDSDVRALGECYAQRIEQLVGDPGAQAGGVCQMVEPIGQQLAVGPLQNFHLQRLRGGTGPRASASENFPIPGSGCVDFGDAPKDDDSREWIPGGGFRSNATCNAATAKMTATADAGALAYPAVGAPLVSIGRATTTLETRLDPVRGIVSVARAEVHDISISDVVQIGRIATVAETATRGRTGSAEATYSRAIHSVVGPNGFTCDKCDPHVVVDVINAAFGGSVLARIPAPHTVASPRGYTAAVVKDPALGASDAAINSDDGFTVDGMYLVYVGDYSNGSGFDEQNVAGRSRVVLTLASVQAEAHYGVFALPPAPTGGSTDDAVDMQWSRTDAGPYSGGPSAPAPPTARFDVPAIDLPAESRSRTPQSIAEAVRLVVNNPAQAALLALFLAILASPVYFAVRRRAVASVWQQV